MNIKEMAFRRLDELITPNLSVPADVDAFQRQPRVLDVFVFIFVAFVLFYEKYLKGRF